MKLDLENAFDSLGPHLKAAVSYYCFLFDNNVKPKHFWLDKIQFMLCL